MSNRKLTPLDDDFEWNKEQTQALVEFILSRKVTCIPTHGAEVECNSCLGVAEDYLRAKGLHPSQIARPQ